MAISNGQRLAVLSFGMRWLDAARVSVAACASESHEPQARYAQGMVAVLALHSAKVCVAKAAGAGTRVAQKLEAQCGHLSAIRDALVHAEDYSAGDGRRQRPARGKPVFVPGETYTRFVNHSPGHSTMMFWMSPADSIEVAKYDVDLDATLRAVAQASVASHQEIDGTEAPEWVRRLAAPEPTPAQEGPRQLKVCTYTPLAGRRLGNSPSGMET